VSEATKRRSRPDIPPPHVVKQAEGLLDAGATYAEAAAQVGCSEGALSYAVGKRRNPLPPGKVFAVKGYPEDRPLMEAVARPDETYKATFHRLLVDEAQRLGIAAASA
jgi:hypothetical protein